MYHNYEIIKGRFEFNNIRTDETITTPDICNWYFESDRANEEIIDQSGDHLTADGLYHDVFDTAHTSYNRGAGILEGYIMFLQCAQYDENNEFVQAHIIRQHAEPVIQNK